ncbi:MAG: hypothetical protein FWD93_02315, partial [Coriobacteriia bacterium]|nr:hypothetical protein [Coriobacteriia bacterium]
LGFDRAKDLGAEEDAASTSASVPAPASGAVESVQPSSATDAASIDLDLSDLSDLSSIDTIIAATDGKADALDLKTDPAADTPDADGVTAETGEE